MTISVSHVGICVSDLDRSLAFYRDGLGFTPTMAHSVGPEFGTLMEVEGVALRSQFVARDGLTIELLAYDNPGVTGDGSRRPMNQLGLTHINLRVDDVDEVAVAIAAHGGTVLPATRTTFGDVMDFVYCTDPDGVRIELMKLPSAVPAG